MDKIRKALTSAEKVPHKSWPRAAYLAVLFPNLPKAATLDLISSRGDLKHKIVPLLLHGCDLATAANCDVNI